MQNSKPALRTLSANKPPEIAELATPSNRITNSPEAVVLGQYCQMVPSTTKALCRNHFKGTYCHCSVLSMVSTFSNCSQQRARFCEVVTSPCHVDHGRCSENYSCMNTNAVLCKCSCYVLYLITSVQELGIFYEALSRERNIKVSFVELQFAYNLTCDPQANNALWKNLSCTIFTLSGASSQTVYTSGRFTLIFTLKDTLWNRYMQAKDVQLGVEFNLFCIQLN